MINQQLDITNKSVVFSSASEVEIATEIRLMNMDFSFENAATFPINNTPIFVEEVQKAKRQLLENNAFILVRPMKILTNEENRFVSWILIHRFGEPLVQNKEGNKLIQVYDRDRTKRLEDGARYHQTRQGGSIHTDNVNIPIKWEFLAMYCVATAMVGGETILLSGMAAHDYLKNNVPEVLSILEQPFCWEYRGISDNTYQAPIITYSDSGIPQFRYLREYLHSAHQKLNIPLSSKQLWALDTLDSVLELSQLQLKFLLNEGETIIILDSQVFHGRTTFSDYDDAQPVGSVTPGGKLKRTIDRAWLKEGAL